MMAKVLCCRPAWAVVVGVCLPTLVAARTPRDQVVMASAVVQADPPKITLEWPADSNAVAYLVYRKSLDGDTWGKRLATLPGDAVRFADANVQRGQVYEYRVVKLCVEDKDVTSFHSGVGYLLAGIEAPLVDQRGRILLVVEKTHAKELAAELARLERDLVGDGWEVVRRDVDRADPVTKVKGLIKDDYDSEPKTTRAVLLFGAVPIPYSGQLNPDGHGARAWAADPYYGCLAGEWTDKTVNLPNPKKPRFANIPDDGKFDQDFLPADMELEVGRVDLRDLPAFEGKTEKDLLRQYLDKNHRFRHKSMSVEVRGLIHDKFGDFRGEAFAQNGWRNFAPMFTAERVVAAEFFKTLETDSYLWAYACAGGANPTRAGFGGTSDVVATDPKVVFTMLFGSYLGEWDDKDSILRAILATPSHGLTSCWGGRPNWQFHPMALGHHIGFCARRSQNNTGKLYNSGLLPLARGVHMALMGDPTLRLHPVAPPADLAVRLDQPGVIELAWKASSDDVKGYHVYRADKPLGPFSRLTANLIGDTKFRDDSVPKTGKVHYMVRAVKLQSSPSGTYYNPSQGVFLDVEPTPTENQNRP
jgi:hypothetical protein